MHADGSPRLIRKFGVYDDDRPVFDWVRDGVAGRRQCVEAQVMDLADDIAYSVHDVEDGVVAGRVDLTVTRRGGGVGDRARLVPPRRRRPALDEALARMRAVGLWPGTPYDGSRRGLASLKNLTSDLIGRFCAAAQDATFASYDGPLAAPCRRPRGARRSRWSRWRCSRASPPTT